MTALPRLAITPGEPAGIGPDLCLMLAREPVAAGLVVIADPQLLRERAARLGIQVAIHEYKPGPPLEHHRPGELHVLPVALATPCEAGRTDPANAPYVLETLRRAVHGCLTNEFDALVTGPVHKGVINEAGIPFTGHTEFLQELTRAPQVVMMLMAGDLRVALATTHLPLREVSDAITAPLLESVVRVLHADLLDRLGIGDPRILVCGLNPHAGEGGHLGREDQDVIEPTLERLRAEGMRLTGPLPADTLFTPRNLRDADAVLAMYHDQGLPVLKYVGFGNAVNVTLGLPVVRTSVDHGTALDRAGTGSAEAGSLHAAVQAALDIVARSQEKRR